MTVNFGTYTSPTRYTGMAETAFYIKTRDGVRIAVSLYLPADLPASDRLPAIIVSTRYWRKQDLRFGFKWLGAAFEKAMQFFVERGYAMLSVDVRGTGASFGTRRHEWDSEEIQDNQDIVDWIIGQSWSNGRVGGYGTSYSGTTAELLTVVNHPAVKAVVPRFNEFDLYTDIAFPGGAYLRGFVEAWGDANAHLDANRLPTGRMSALEKIVMQMAIRGVAPVDADRNRQMLQQAVADHATNIQANVLSQGIDCRDDRVDIINMSIDDYSVHRYQDQIEASGATIYGWGGWLDAVTADAVIRRFLTLSNPQIAVIGAWNHGAGQHASPYNPHANDVTQHWHETLRYFDHYLRGDDTGVTADVAAKTLFYFTMGQEVWKQTDQWPPAGTTMRRWYLGENHTLQSDSPTASDAHDRYQVDFEATSGKTNRWYTQMGGAVFYPDRAEADQLLLHYTSPPLSEAIEITGHPVVSLQVTSDADDGLFIVYLEHVTPEGDVHYLTEGVLRAVHRRYSPSTLPYTIPIPVHSFKREDMQPLVAGEMAEITLALLPTSVWIPAGHRIRVAIAGADDDLFPRIPANKAPVVDVHRSPLAASYIDLPIVEG